MKYMFSVAYGEMSQARDLLSLLLSTADQAPPIPGVPVGTLTSTIVSKSAEIPSVQAFHAQLLLGGKDEALRKSAAAFKSAADSMERVRLRGEKYWSDALRTRNDNWGLVPAPLPPGAPIGKGADKTARDFWITFGLAECKLSSRLRCQAMKTRPSTNII
jgi:mediator of RNA polymerase II transcription subunit 17, fungi type